VNGRDRSLDVLRLRNLVSWLAGIGVEALLPLVLAGVAALVLAAFRLLGG
jgi:hypothetical protein